MDAPVAGVERQVRHLAKRVQTSVEEVSESKCERRVFGTADRALNPAECPKAVRFQFTAR